MKLSENQIQELYIFTRKHYVEWYDLQTELVDHLANDIENILVKNPEMPFEKALNLSFNKFGVFGFADVIAKRQNVLEKKYYSMLWLFLKEYFGLPKIIFTLFLACLFYLLFGFLGKTFLFQIMLSIFLLLAIISLYLTFRNKRKLEEDFGLDKKKYMLQDIATNTSSISQFFILILHIFNLIEFNFKPDTQAWIFSFLLTTTILIGYISFFVLPKKIDTYLSETYPEYVIST